MDLRGVPVPAPFVGSGAGVSVGADVGVSVGADVDVDVGVGVGVDVGVGVGVGDRVVLGAGGAGSAAETVAAMVTLSQVCALRCA